MWEAAPQNDYFSCFLISFYCPHTQTHTHTIKHTLTSGNFHNNAALGVAAAAVAATLAAMPPPFHPLGGKADEEEEPSMPHVRCLCRREQ